MDNIKTIRLVRFRTESKERDVIKEFFRCIGCLFYDKVVDSPEDLYATVYSPNIHDIDIILNEKVNFDITKQMGNKSYIVLLNYSIEKTKRMVSAECMENGEKIVYSYPSNMEYQDLSKKELASGVLKILIDCMWNRKDEQWQRNILQIIRTLYVKHSLFQYLHNKRNFRILNMRRILGRDSGFYKIQPSEYIREMVDSFDAFYTDLRRMSGAENSVYYIYVKVNAARKIREIFNLLEYIPEDLSKYTNIRTIDEMLNDLGNIHQLDQDYIGTYFLASYVCQLDQEHSLRAKYYYQILLDKNGKSIFGTFMYYMIGRYYEKTWNDCEKAFFYYDCAYQLDHCCYQALYKIAQYKLSKKKYREALNDFQEVVFKILENYPMNCIAPKGIQYLYKTYIWIGRIYAEYYEQLNETKRYFSKALEIAIVFEQNKYYEEIFDEDEFKQIIEYHKNSLPVKVLFLECREWARRYHFSDLEKACNIYL